MACSHFITSMEAESLDLTVLLLNAQQAYAMLVIRSGYFPCSSDLYIQWRLEKSALPALRIATICAGQVTSTKLNYFDALCIYAYNKQISVH